MRDSVVGAGEAGSVAGARTDTAAAWRSVGILCLIYACSFVDRQIMSLMVGPIRADLGITDTQLSVLHGFAFAVFYAAFGLPIGAWVDRADRRVVLSLGVAVWSAFTALCGTAGSFWELFAYRVGVGIGEATVVPATYSLLADYFSRERRGVAMGVFGAGVYLGLGAALIAGGAIVAALTQVDSIALPGLGTLRPWQVVFVLVGAPGLVFAGLVLLVHEPRRRPSSARHQSRIGTPRSLLADCRRNFAAILSHHGTTALLAMALYGLVAWTPEFFHRTHHMAIGVAGIQIGLVVALAGMAGVITGGAVSDLLVVRGYEAARLITMLAAAFCAIPCAALFPQVESATLASILAAVTVFFLAALTAAGPTGVQELYPPALRGVGSAVFQLIVTLVGLGLGPTVVALVSDRVLRDELRLGDALSYSLPVMLLLAAGIAAVGLRSYRRAMSEMRTNVK